MDSSSEPVKVQDNSNQGEYLKWVDENDEMTEEEKRLLREVHYDG